MKKLIAISAALALAACNGAETNETEVESDTAADVAATEDDSILEGDAPGFEAVAPGTYQVTRAGDQVDYIEIHPGMTFSRVDADGEATGGVIFMKDGMTCFLVEGAEQEDCFTDGPTQADGSMETTSEAGDISTVMPVEGSLEDHVG
ncbi:hypothetical protein [Aurantiacibacter poecillastricola]|uniref:hypothetical protein n=1 Tax=Aurantiacibacter poecillastricola TaxID=3064385 RepID=UPI00273D02D4|nr:hypothetical protein [Aurantiacibacter sp. 219JJ12-13]MDP5262135.1 hypothetical protein [Aurantiacibacter sp. 219JJ12-13]